MLVEFYCSHWTTFSIKKKYFEQNREKIEWLFLGTSHMQNAVNPEFLKPNAANLAFAGQPIEINYEFLRKYVSQMPALKIVFLEISDHSFYSEFHSDDWNGHIYANLYSMYYKVSSPSIENHSYLMSNFKFFSSIFIDYINPWTGKYEINKYGYITNDFNDRFQKLHNDSLIIDSTFIMAHEFDKPKLLLKNKDILTKSIALCQSRGIKVVLITPPLYHTYLEKIPRNAKLEVSQIVKTIQRDFNVPYFDYSDDGHYSLLDFKNDNHLNSNGARKFSLEIDSFFRRN
ncbi:MAG: hypothetical protein WKF66_00330 [Pedobacter sp.]